MPRQFLRTLGILALALPMAATAAEGEDGDGGGDPAYFGGSYLDFAEREAPDNQYSPSGLMLRIGQRFNENVAVDFQAGASQTVSGFQVSRFTGLFLQLGGQWERIHFYTQLGPARTEIKMDGATEVNDGIAYGFGARVSPSDTFDIVVEWMDYTVGAEERLDAIGIGFVRPFGQE
ncbi:MAG: outer membrane beta-barrel protein [Pseudomonadota bacterium]